MRVEPFAAEYLADAPADLLHDCTLSWAARMRRDAHRHELGFPSRAAGCYFKASSDFEPMLGTADERESLAVDASLSSLPVGQGRAVEARYLHSQWPFAPAALPEHLTAAYAALEGLLRQRGALWAVWSSRKGRAPRAVRQLGRQRRPGRSCRGGACVCPHVEGCPPRGPAAAAGAAPRLLSTRWRPRRPEARRARSSTD